MKVITMAQSKNLCWNKKDFSNKNTVCQGIFTFVWTKNVWIKLSKLKAKGSRFKPIISIKFNTMSRQFYLRMFVQALSCPDNASAYVLKVISHAESESHSFD